MKEPNDQIPRIGLLVDTATGWGRRIVRGVLDYANQFGPWNICIEPKGQSESFEIPQHMEVDGVIARVATAKLAQELNELNRPVVNISGLIVNSGDFPRICIDWDASAQLAQAHFRDRAIRNFAYVGPLHHDFVQHHEQAFESALAKTGTHCHVYQPQTPVIENELWHARSDNLVPWLKGLPKPVGIFTWGFEIGRDVVNACRIAGLSVPHDVAVLGGDYDDLLSDACHPPLSGIVTPSVQIGYQAAAVLHAMMQGKPSPAEPVFVPPEEVQERLSTEVLAIDDPKILQALTYLRTHAFQPIKVDDILHHVPMARRSLERRFNQILGRTPQEEIRNLRINRAKKLLAETDLSMQEVAEACGYTSYNYLGTVFKREAGMSPTAYRKKARSH